MKRLQFTDVSLSDILIAGVHDEGCFSIESGVKVDLREGNKNKLSGKDLLSIRCPGKTASRAARPKKNSQNIGAHPVCQPLSDASAPAPDDGGDIRELLGVGLEDNHVRVVVM